MNFLEKFNAICDWIREYVNYGDGQIIMYFTMGFYIIYFVIGYIELNIKVEWRKKDE